MALHFSLDEFNDRMERLKEAMAERKLDAMLIFAQESMYWLTGYDSFGFCFFQCLVVKSDGDMLLLTRAPDLRQARHTSIIENIALWIDRQGADPTQDLHNVMSEMDLVGMRIGIEYDTAGLNGRYGVRLNERMRNFADISDASDLVAGLRAVKSKAEMAHIRKAAALADDAFDEAVKLTRPGVDEGEILSAMHAAIFSAGGDYPGNEFIIGSGKDALLCRYKSGRRKLTKNDQLTLEWAGTWAHYHAAMMRTLIVGKPKPRHLELYEVAREAMERCRDAIQVEQPISRIFDAHAKVLDGAGLARHRLNACGYSLGARFSPTWMDTPMIYGGNDQLIQANMVLFVHIIIADSDTDTAMTLGQTYVSAAAGPKALSRHEIDLIVR